MNQLGNAALVGLLLASVGICAFILALFGIGRIGEHGLGVQHEAWPMATVLGLALLVAVGGLLNLLGYAFRTSLLAIVVIGLASAAWQVQSTWRKATRPRPFSLGVAVVAVLTMFFALATLVPATVFNAGDDLQKYFAHPAHMLQVGRVSNSTLGAMGFETLGGQAFLHGFVLAVAGFDCLNAVELGLALPLCITLAGIGPVRGALQGLTRVVGIAAIVLVNPQVVNISSSFTSVALLLGILLLSPEGPKPDRERGHARACGVMLAALCALKSSLGLIALGVAGALIAALFLHTRDLRRAWIWGRTAGTTAIVCLLPWILIHGSNWASALAAPPIAPLPPPAYPYGVSLFSGKEFRFGIGCAPFTVAVASALILGLFAWLTAPRAEGRRPWSACLAFTAAPVLALTYVVSMHVVGPAGQGAQTTLRLFIPVLLGCLPAIAILATQHVLPLSPPRVRTLAAAALVFVILPMPRLAFALSARVEQALKYGSILHFRASRSPWYVTYNRFVLHGDLQSRIARIQTVVPAGAPLVAWVYAPFYLDFRRNTITEGDHAGMATPWAAMPAVTYVLWEYNCLMAPSTGELEAARREPALLEARTADAGLRLRRTMETLRTDATVLADDGRFIVLKLSDGRSLQRLFSMPY